MLSHVSNPRLVPGIYPNLAKGLPFWPKPFLFAWSRTDEGDGPVQKRVMSSATRRHSYPSLVGLKVLIVDDDKTNCEVFQRIFKVHGLKTDVAHDGPDFIEKVRAERYDAVCLDVMMPGMSGLDALTLLQESGQPSRLPPIFVLTAHASSVVARQARDLAVEHVYPKPVRFPVLLKAMEKSLASGS